MNKLLRAILCLLPVVALCLTMLSGYNRSEETEDPSTSVSAKDLSENITTRH